MSSSGETIVAEGAPSPFAGTVTDAGARMVRGGIWQTAAQLAPYVMTTIVSIVAARALGPDRMGRQSYISFIVLTTMTVCSAGFPGSIPRYVGELIGRGEEGKLPSLAAWSWRVEAVAGSLGAAVLFAIAALGGQPRLAWVFGGAATLAGVLHKVPGSILNGAQRWRQSSVVVLATGAGAMVATVVALSLGGGITSIFVVLALANSAMLLWAAILAHRLLADIGAPRTPLGPLRREITRFALAASVPMILNFVVFQRSEFFFLDRYSSDRQIALYSIAYSVYAALLALPAALGNMFAPAVATLLGARAFDRIRSGYARGLRLLLFVSIPLSAAAVVFGPPLIGLVYGAQYRGAGPLLLVLVAPLLVVPAGGLSGGLLFGYGRIRVPVLIGVVSGVVDLGLAALLVPHLDAFGAAIANICAQLAGGLLGIGYCVRLVGGVQFGVGHLARMAVAAAVAGGCAELVFLFGTGAGPLVLAAVLAAAVWATLSVALGVLPREDAAWLVGALGAGRRPRLRRICERLSGSPLGAG